ncbi:MAG: ABC transporter substrate-binding protein [Deltaproteobacteria bacterium]|jgi:iron complex transport system substrate-binding protein|nr:ABC transporter substrate-binding protein [Deltaproteobacteria bacterium]
MRTFALVKIIGLCLILALGLGIAGPGPWDGYPMSFENKGRVVTVNSQPKKVLTYGVPAAEIMAALGLSQFVVGQAYAGEGLLPEFEEALKGVPKIYAASQARRKITQGADFIIGRFKPDALELTWDWLPVYVLETKSLEEFYQQVRDLGRIFRIETQAEKVLTKLNESLARTTGVLKNYEPVKALVLDQREDGSYVAGGMDFESRLVNLAGGNNIFADQPGWSKVPAEEILARQPEAVVILAYGSVQPELRLADLKADPILSNLDAVAHDKILVLPFYTMESGIRSALAVDALARFFHPSLFNAPDPGP